ncbi:ATP phosphoribosyltransferase [Candidatus Nasuia deltocephalinicola str. NAS-ALF]|uniref:ATP phosphoribosyltransferase n=1 Tax=Candidatus Nasuia deltocephalinicola str. NAS-ALF TaxID=1343077 RepID=S5SPY6_9PROT|nr:ATP phosphoribosyltransferase [Candidatus Nasuia deltocephalinicola str. NAS-ALF]
MKIIICLPKGRNLKESLIFLLKKNLKLFEYNNRKLYIKTSKKNIYILIIKNNDFKIYKKNNFSDFIFLGSDMILNYYLNFFYNYKYLKINTFFISIISNSSYINNLKLLKFYTKYKKILKSYLNFKNIKYRIYNMKGSVENSCILKSSNLILDISESGKTIKDNKIIEIKKIAIFNNYLIYNINILYIKIFIYLEMIYVKNTYK